jgi:hypothetical protein
MGELSALRAIARERHVHRSWRTSLSDPVGRVRHTTPDAKLTGLVAESRQVASNDRRARRSEDRPRERATSLDPLEAFP